MKFENIGLAKTLHDQILKLACDRELAASRQPNTLAVTISGRYQDDGVVSCVRNAVLNELDRRISTLVYELEQLGGEAPETSDHPIEP